MSKEFNYEEFYRQLEHQIKTKGDEEYQEALKQAQEDSNWKKSKKKKKSDEEILNEIQRNIRRQEFLVH